MRSRAKFFARLLNVFLHGRSPVSTLCAAALAKSAAGFQARNSIERQLLRWFNEMTRGSRISQPKYNAITDADPRGLLTELHSRLAPGPSAVSGLVEGRRT